LKAVVLKAVSLIFLLLFFCLIILLKIHFENTIKGGDLPEAVADGLHDALKLSWREKSTKICVLISDGNFIQLSTFIIYKCLNLS